MPPVSRYDPVNNASMVDFVSTRFSLSFLAIYLGILSPAVMGAASDWNCAKGGDGGAWVCGSKTSLNQSRETDHDTIELGADPSSAPNGSDASTPIADPEDQPELLRSKAPFEKTLLPQGDPAKARVSGWNCTPGLDEGPDRGWVCSLSGRDPRGLAHVVSEEGEETENWAESNTITREDEDRFENMMGLMPVNPWQRSCAPKVGKKRPPPLSEFILTPEEKLAREKAPIDIQSDYFELIDNEVTNFTGSAEMVKADQTLWGDYITRNLKTNAVNVHGNVTYKDKGLAISSDSAFMDGKESRGVFRNSQFILPAVPGRGTSRLTHVDSSDLSRYENFSYTTCPPGDQDWLLHSSKVKINKDTGTGTAQHAWFEFMDVPFLYTPYMEFPIDKRRVSGLLTPNFGITQVSGVDLSIPYYFNLAPNYDYTVQPRYLTKRGFMLRNDFRYMDDMSRTRLVGDILPYDDETKTTRGEVGFRDDTRFSEDIFAHIDANWVSDFNYLNQLGSPLNLVDYRNIASIATLNYNSPIGPISTMANYFQTIDPSTPRNLYPYFYLPKLEHNFGQNIADTGLQFSNQTQFASIQADSNIMTMGQRFLIRPKLTYPMENSSGFIRPSATLAFNQYILQSPQYWSEFQKNLLVNTTTNSSENYTVPIFSLDSGTYFDRDFSLGDTPMQQTLEPRLFYVYIPTVNQQNIPLFDTTSYDFTYYQLFRENRYAGYDRVGDANNLTAAFTSRLIDQTTGIERFRSTLGNLAYFEGRQVTPAGPPPDTYAQSFSNLIGDIYGSITDHWSVYTAGQYNPSFNQIERGQVELQYNNKQNMIFNAAYRYRKDQYTGSCAPSFVGQNFITNNFGCLNLTDVSMRLPIFAGWNAIGRWQYSLLNNVTTESFFGFERETCCWRFSLIGRRYLNTINADGTAQSNNAVFLQFELKGLTSLGDQVDRFLERSITGYRYRDY
ncbi:MAG: LPS assembly protein LptD [Methylococcaceae bacterium]|nr:LPS assembly protein LptD [Methylococcaceae bacterium]